MPLASAVIVQGDNQVVDCFRLRGHLAKDDSSTVEGGTMLEPYQLFISDEEAGTGILGTRPSNRDNGGWDVVTIRW